MCELESACHKISDELYASQINFLMCVCHVCGHLMCVHFRAREACAVHNLLKKLLNCIQFSLRSGYPHLGQFADRCEVFD